MSIPRDPTGGPPRTGPRLMPGPHLMPGAVAGPVGGAVDPGLADAVTERVQDLLGQVDDLREHAGTSFDLVALARQSALLEQAHEALTAALAEVDRR